ncbi:MAG: alpha-dextrin endo,6-alpha-glucosidase [Chitinophagaceae bacterium]|jgi:metallo-beta-lactamase class B|nr:alpha-dextrin endo,6-alpha-glucosidase [Chitinophagaceae bacterium]
MKKHLLLFVLLLVTFAGYTQYTLKLVVTSTPKPTVNVAQRAAEPIYVAGNFNNWAARDEMFKLKPLGTRLSILLKDIPAGMYAFKFTRGDWSKVETTGDGRDIADRIVEVKGDMTVEFAIEGWKDDYPDKPKPYTASPQVKIIDTAFNIPQLDRKRRVWVYLPKGYLTAKTTYPVLYMHDGQNLFNEQTAPFGEWGVDEAMDSMQKLTGKEMIVVGIDHGGDKRMSEYNPYDHKQYGKGEGDKYLEFLATTLKPYIDQKYRTKQDAANTHIAGSSMGGLISLYAVVKYPQVFGSAGVFSPAFWTAPDLFSAVEKVDWSTTRPKVYFYAGAKEGTTMVPDMKRMVTIVEGKKGANVVSVVNPLGQHNEPAWRKQFPNFFRFINGLPVNNQVN